MTWWGGLRGHSAKLIPELSPEGWQGIGPVKSIPGVVKGQEGWEAGVRSLRGGAWPGAWKGGGPGSEGLLES